MANPDTLKYQDPARSASQPKADPSNDAPPVAAPESPRIHDAVRADFTRLALKSSLDHGCVNCGQPGSTFPCCNEVICDQCAKWFYPPEGHMLADHLRDQPVPEESAVQKLLRENEELMQQVYGTAEDRLRRKNDVLRHRLQERSEA